MIGDDLTALFASDPADPGLRQGTVLTFNQATGANTIRVGATTLTNLPFLENSGVVNLAQNDVVLIQRFRASWFIIGRIIPVGSSRFAAASVATQSTSTSVVGGFGLTNSSVAKASCSLVVPSWANTATVMSVVHVTARNTTASGNFLFVSSVINGTSGAEAFCTCPAGEYTGQTAAAIRTFGTTGGATITFTANARTDTGTFATDGSNTASVDAIVTFTKV